MELTLSDILRMFKRWLKLFLIVFFATAIATVVVYKILPKEYTATAVLKIEGTSGPAIGSLGGLPAIIGLTKSGGGIEDYIEIMKSRSVLEKVVTKLDLVSKLLKPENIQKLLEKGFTKDDLVEIVVRSLQNNLEISTVGKSSLISVSYKSKDPKLSYSIVKEVVWEFEEFTKQLSYQSVSKKKAFLEEKLKDLEKTMKTQLTALVDFQKKHGVISLEDEISFGAEALTQVKVSYLKALASAPQGMQGKAEIYYKGANEGALGSMIASLISLENQLAADKILSPENNLQLKVLEEKIKDLRSRISLLKLSQLNDYEDTLEAYKENLYKLLELEPNYYFLQAKLDLLKDLSSYVWQQYIQTLLSEISLISPVTIVSPAKLTHIPEALSTKLVGAIGGALGIFLGILAVFWRESTYPTVTDYILFAREKGLESFNVIRLNHLQEDVNRTALRFKERKGVFLVASSNDGDGKTSIALNLALAMKKLGVNALIVNGDEQNQSLLKQAEGLGIEAIPFSTYKESPSRKAEVVFIDAPSFQRDPLSYAHLLSLADNVIVVIGEMNSHKQDLEDLLALIEDRGLSRTIIFNKVRWMEA